MLLPRLAESARGLTGADGAALAWWREGAIRCEARSGSLAPPLGAIVDIESGISGECFRSGQPIRCADTERDRLVNREVARELGLRSLAAVPIIDDSECVGLLEVFSGNPDTFTDEHLEILQELAGLAAATRRARQGLTPEPLTEDDAQQVHLQAVRQAIANAAPDSGAEVNFRQWLPIAVPALILTLVAAVAGGWYYGKSSLGADASAKTTARTEPVAAPIVPSPGTSTLVPNGSKPRAALAADKALGVEPAAARAEEAAVGPGNPAPLVVSPGGRAPQPDTSVDTGPPPIETGGVVSSSTLAGILQPNSDLPTLSLPISQGLSGGMLKRRVDPAYPATAKEMRIEGTVVLQATVTKEGALENIQIVSGPPPLTAAAVDAVRKWRYTPYLLNGDPVEVQTNITLQFKLPR
jgi:protein TonB